MRIIGIILVVAGLIALAVPSFTYFTTDHGVNTNFFSIDVQRPHTIVLNPAVGIVAAIAGVAMIFADRRTAAV